MENKTKKPLIGMRTFKTGLAVMITLLIAEIGVIVNPIYATIGTVLVMQQTVKGSFLMGKNRLLGTLIGGIFAYFIALVYIDMYIGRSLLIAAGVVITIRCCNALKLNDSISIALTVLLSILIGIDEHDPLIYSTIRIWDTSIGVLVGIIINYSIAQPNYRKALTDEVQAFYRILCHVANDKEFNITTEDLEVIKQNMKELDDSYRQFIADLPFGGEDAELEKAELEEVIEVCHDVYFHAKSLCFLEDSDLDASLNNQFKEYHEEKLKGAEIFLFYISSKESEN